MSSAIARRYAKALFDLAVEDNALNEVRNGLETLSRSLQDHADLSEVCMNPMFSREEHLKVLDAVMKREESPRLVVQFIELLVAKHRLIHLHGIVRFFGELVDAAKGVETVQVRSPKRLSAEDETRLKDRLEAGFGRKVALTIEEAPELLAGITVTIGSKVFDGTARGRLAELRATMLREIQSRPSGTS